MRWCTPNRCWAFAILITCFTCAWTTLPWHFHRSRAAEVPAIVGNRGCRIRTLAQKYQEKRIVFTLFEGDLWLPISFFWSISYHIYFDIILMQNLLLFRLVVYQKMTIGESHTSYGAVKIGYKIRYENVWSNIPTYFLRGKKGDWWVIRMPILQMYLLEHMNYQIWGLWSLWLTSCPYLQCISYRLMCLTYNLEQIFLDKKSQWSTRLN